VGAAARVRNQSHLCVTFCGKRDTGTVLLPSILVCVCQYYSTNTPTSYFIHLPATKYNLINWHLRWLKQAREHARANHTGRLFRICLETLLVHIYQKSRRNHDSECQKDDMKQIPYWGPTNIRRHRTKFSCPGIV
jgi:hypothetical protein